MWGGGTWQGTARMLTVARYLESVWETLALGDPSSVGPFLPTSDSTKRMGSSEKQHIEGVISFPHSERHVASTSLQGGKTVNSREICSLSEWKIRCIVSSAPCKERGGEVPLSPASAQPVTSLGTWVCLFSKLQEHLLGALQSPV